MRIIKYLLKHKAALAIVLVLLVGQAFCDLALPNLTSDIVDVGIQQSGIEHIATEKMRESTYETALTLADADQRSLLEQSYTREADGTYDLNDYGRKHMEELDDTLSVPMAYTYVMEQAAASGEVQTTITSDNFAEGDGDFYGEPGVDAGVPSEAAQPSSTPTSTPGSWEDSSDLPQNYESLVSAEGFGGLEAFDGEYNESIVAQAAIQGAIAEYKALGYDTSGMQMTYLLKTGGLMLALAALGMVIAIVVGFVASRTGAAIGAELRSKLFTRVVSFSEAEIGRFSAASLITRGTNDIQLIQNVSIMMMRMVLYAPILAIGGIIMVMQTNPRMGWIIVVAIVAVFVVISVLFKLAMPKFKIMQKLIDRVNLVAREILTGMPVIRAFGRTQSEEARFDVASTELMRTQLFTNRVMTFMMPTMMLIMNATSVAIVWVGGHYIDEGLIQTGDMIAFITYSMVIIMGFLMLGMISIMLPRADVAASRVDEVIATEPSIHDAEGAVALVAADGDSACLSEFAGAGGAEATPLPSAKSATIQGAKVEFCDVSFKYDDTSECVLEHVSFIVEPGQTLGIIGATGCGKSTIMKLIERFYDTSAGAVKIDGIDVREISQASLRHSIAYVPQKAFLFSGTIESNVAYSEGQMDAARVTRALRLAQASEFVDALPEGAASPISEGGTNVSGGQRQRLAIARALAADARVLLFDDSFSALDYKTDLALRTALDSELAGVTRIIAAQRIATIRNADCIVVLDDGRMVGYGTHDDLIRNCEQYKEIALSQLSEEELGLEGGDL